MNQKLMDIKDLAAYLQMNKMTIYKLAREGTIPAFKVASEWRFRKDLVDAWLMRQVTKASIPCKRPKQTVASTGAYASKKVLVVDDEPIIRDLFASILSEYTIEKAATGEEALEAILQNRPDLVLLDYRMPGIDGIETLKRIKAIDDSIVVVMLSAYMTHDLDLQAVRLGAYTSLSKPIDPEDIRQIIEEATQPQLEKSAIEV